MIARSKSAYHNKKTVSLLPSFGNDRALCIQL
jgi:hypothetical protein